MTDIPDTRLQLTFRKGPEARFLSHLDLMSTFEYAVRRARLPVAFTQGFNPRPRLAVAAPLALGHIGAAELLDIALREPVPAGEVRQRLQSALPAGIQILEVQALPAHAKALAARIRGASYRTDLPGSVPHLGERVHALLARQALLVTEARQDGIRHRDLRPYLLSIEVDGDACLSITVHLDNEGSVRPEQILALLEIPLDGVRITRERLILD